MCENNASSLGRAARAIVLTLLVVWLGAATAHADIITDLKAYWTFEETSGTTANDIHGGYDGSIVNAGTGVLLGQPGMFGNAYEYVHTAGGRVDVPGVIGGVRLVPTTGPFSFFAWIKKGSQTSQSTIFYVDAHVDNRAGVTVLPNGNLDWWHHGGIIDLTGGSVDDNDWHHVGITREADNHFRLWLDGEYIQGGPSGTNIAATGWRFGNNGFGNFPYSGLIDDAAVWGTALTEAEARATYNLGVDFSYDLAAVTELFAAYGHQGSATVGNEYWWYTDGLNALAPEGLRVGELWEQNGRAYLLLDAAGTGAGMMIPEPATWLLLLSALACGLLVRRRSKE